tara:strand:- start:4791 stop:5642 length:852 start_codon:yes stop_codon:yes gene_type:complete
MRNNQTRLGHVPGSPAAQPAAQFASQDAAPQPLYSVPTEFVRLPSKGKFYPQDHPLFEKQEIEIKYMTAKEEDLLASEELFRNGLLVERLIESLIVDKRINPRTLLVGDRNAIMIASRVSAYGANYTASVPCTECGKVTEEFEFNLKKGVINTKFTDAKYLSKHNLTFDEENRIFVLTLPNSQITVGFRMMTGQDFDTFDDVHPNSTVTQTLSKLIVSVQGSFDREQVRSFVEHMPASDSKFLRKLYVEIIPSIDLKQEFQCAHCGFVSMKEVPLDAGFFWPE